MIENIVTPQPFLRVYPDAAAVFADPPERYARHLLPLVSIDLQAVNPDWHGWIHLLNPCEPAEGCVGDSTGAHHSYYCRSNWVGFRLNAENRYELLGDWRYFALENDQEAYPGQHADLQAHYDEQHRVYELGKADFQQQGRVYPPFFLAKPHRYERPDEPSTILDQLGGGVGWGNWCSTSDLPLDESDEDNIVPLSPEGQRFHFVACVPGDHYCASGASWVLLFFEPDSRTALLTFDWT